MVIGCTCNSWTSIISRSVQLYLKMKIVIKCKAITYITLMAEILAEENLGEFIFTGSGQNQVPLSFSDKIQSQK